jgi:hypothetical protein
VATSLPLHLAAAAASSSARSEGEALPAPGFSTIREALPVVGRGEAGGIDDDQDLAAELQDLVLGP